MVEKQQRKRFVRETKFFRQKCNFLGEKTHVATFSFTCENDETKSVSAFLLAPLVWLQNLCSFDKKKKKKFTHARKMVSL